MAEPEQRRGGDPDPAKLINRCIRWWRARVSRRAPSRLFQMVAARKAKTGTHFSRAAPDQ